MLFFIIILALLGIVFYIFLKPKYSSKEISPSICTNKEDSDELIQQRSYSEANHNA